VAIFSSKVMVKVKIRVVQCKGANGMYVSVDGGIYCHHWVDIFARSQLFYWQFTETQIVSQKIKFCTDSNCSPVFQSKKTPHFCFLKLSHHILLLPISMQKRTRKAQLMQSRMNDSTACLKAWCKQNLSSQWCFI